MPYECDQCGAEVSADYHRVFSANDGTLGGCTECGKNYGEHGREI